MNQEINNQTTLFRFVSLRSAELTKKEDQDKRFIFHPDYKTGPFFNAIKNNVSNQSKWKAMQIACETFLAFKNEKEVEAINADFFKLADFATRNKNTLDLKELNEKINTLNPLDLKIELNLWDNLFYQVITQKSFYVKESIIQLLVLNNVIKNKLFFSIRDFNELIAKQLLLAKVVLPVELFEEDTNLSNNSNALKLVENQRESNDYIHQELIEAKEIAEAKITAQNSEFLITELKKIELNHYDTYQKEYDKQVKLYQARIKPTIVAYQKKYKEEQRKLCANPRDENYNPDDICYQPDLEYPDLPEFEINLSQEPEIQSLEEQLSEDSFAVLSSSVDLKLIKSFSELKIKIENNLKESHQKIVEKTQSSEQIISFGDTAIALKGSTSNSNDFTFQICTTRLGNGNVSPYMTIQLPNSSYTVQQFIYHLHYTNGGSNTNGFFNQSLNGNVLTLQNMFNNTLPFSSNSIVEGISGYIIFSNGLKYNFEVNPFTLSGCTPTGLLVIEAENGNDGGDNTDNNENSFIPNAFGYRQLGIADYKKVVSKICKYEVGEVAHIENVMARELREKNTTKFHQTQVIETESSEIETEKISDTSTTERFETQTETAKLINEDKQFGAYAKVSSEAWKVHFEAGVNYASNVSKEESNRQAVNQSKEITQRAMERIVSRVKNERTVKTTDEFTEENTHVFDNTESEQHVSGVFRFINAIYKNQIYNYGKRLMYEFMIPQPSKLHRLGMAVSKNNANATTIDKPIDPRINYPTFSSINESNYQLLASKYKADVEIYPETYINLSQSFLKEDWTNDGRWHKSGEFTIKIPENYGVDTVKGHFDPMNGSHPATWGNMSGIIYIGTKRIVIPNRTSEMPIFVSNFDTEIKNEVKITMTTWDIATYNFNLIVKCKLTDSAKVEWQKKTFQAILKGYFDQLAEYNQSLAEAQTSGIQILDSNPLFYRQIEQNVLRQNCISYLLDHSTNANNYKQFGLPMYNSNASFTNFQVNLDKKMDDYGSFAKFMEQAFEWNLMSYNFYPYYWANKDEWKDLYQFESNDAIFRSFMQSGMARVIVTVKPGFEDAVMHYMAFGQIWNGGQMPVLGNPLYLSIIDELKEQEYVVEETWTTTLPTQLIALQKSGVAVDAEGLPNLDICEAKTDIPLVKNTAKLGAKIEK